MIGRQPESADDYLARITTLVADSRTHLYFDTSFLMWLAKLGAQARAQFLAWPSSVGEKRFHVPLWSAHEFFKHRLKNTVAKELSAEIKQFDGAATRLYEKLRVYCSDQLFGFENSGALFLDEFKRTIQPLRGMLKLAEKSEQLEVGVQEVSAYIDRLLLPGPLEDLIADIDIEERIRNRGVIPPSFKDAHKRGARRAEGQGDDEGTAGDNSFGDLIFWREVIRHASSTRTRTVIVITGDRKNDWFENHHGDEGLTEIIRRRVQNPRPVPAAHPLLIREAFDRGAGDLVLLDPIYCGVLLELAGKDYLEFASAALDTQLPVLAGKPAAARSWATRFGAAARIVGAEAKPGKESKPSDESAATDEGEAEFDPALLQIEQLKSKTPLPKNAQASLQALTEGNVAYRVEVLHKLDRETLSQWEPRALIALGRTVLRLAEESDPSATRFISDLRDQAPVLPKHLREPIYFGALGALYFDDQLGRRVATGSLANLTLLDLITLPEVSNAAAAVGNALAESPPLYRPGSGSTPLFLEVITRPSADNKAPADLVAIKLGGINLITTLQTEEPLRFSTLLERPSGSFDTKVGTLLDLLARFHLLPRQLLEPDVNSDLTVRVPEFAGVELDV